MPVTVKCNQCGKAEEVIPARAKTYKFCSRACKGEWQKQNKRGENNHRWTGGTRIKVCQHCGAEFGLKPNQPITTFRKQKFCSKPCADVGGLRYSGPDNWKWTGNPRRKHRESKQSAWARKVISRDQATCQRCGAQGVELQAHHLMPYKDHPELRWELSNGLTLCAPCHWKEHAVLQANGVNSGNLLPGNAGDNPEPSHDGNVVEGVTASGRAYRRWEGSCEWCGTFLSKRLSDAIGKAHHFCSKSCAGKYKMARRMAVISTKSAPPERDDIVWTP